jgi:TPR repeat protein
MSRLAAAFAISTFVLWAAPVSAQSLIVPPSALPSTITGTGPVQPPAPPQSYLSPGVQPDLAFGAFQRGYFFTALREAMKRLETDSKDGPAMTLVGQLYKDGLGVRRDQKEAIRWFKLGADAGDPQGAFSLALAYLRGQGVEESREAAIPWLEKAAAKDHSGAIYNLGMLAIDGDIQDFARANTMFARAAALGNMDAAYALGLLYKEGRGVPRDPALAAQWLRRAADEHIVAAEVDYAVMLFNGDGVEKDEAGAARYFLRAAATNNPVAANRIARLMVAGRGVPKNMIEAMKWHILARSAGVHDDWLDSQLATLNPRERVAVDDAVRKYVGSIGE